jgi:hypothetical protein
MKLPKSQRQILELMSDGRLWSYREITRSTGKYSNLAGELRGNHLAGRSLGAKGLVREGELTMDQMGIRDGLKHKVYTFQATPLAFGVLGIPVPAIAKDPAAAVEDFAQRYREWWKQWREEELLAQKVGLRHNPVVLLRAMATDPMREWTLAELAKATGLFSGLVQDLRARHARHRSLASMGLCRETFFEKDNGLAKFAFTITRAGLALLEGKHAIAPPIRKKPRSRLAPPLPCGGED